MKNLYSLIIASFLSFSLWGQQEEQYTQFMNYKMGLNPAYAGLDDGPTLSALVRNQWIGIEGAPQTQLITFNTPFRTDRVGIGGSIIRQTIGVTQNYTAEAAYAYSLRLGNGDLRLGLSASVRLFSVDFSDLNGTQPIAIDNAVPGDFQSKYIPNFGAGIYYKSTNTYFGVSIPRILQNNIDLADSKDVISKEIRHFYVMAGMAISISDKVTMEPQVLVKYVTGAPFDADVNLNFSFAGFTAGASYRIGGSKANSVGESVSLLLGAQLSEELVFNLSYDATLSPLRSYNSGSVEGVLQFYFGGKKEEPKKDKIKNPRGSEFYK